MAGGEWDFFSSDKYLIYKFVKSDTINYCTYGSEPMTQDKYLSLFFEAAFRYWTLGSAQMLESSDRKNEFKDIIQTLKKPFKLNYLGRCGKNTLGKADIEIISDENFCDDYDGHSYFSDKKTAFKSGLSICLSKKQKDIRVTTAADLFGLQIPLSKISKKRLAKGLEFLENLKNKKIAPLAPNIGHIPPSFCIMLHETGHAFGLSDEYANEKNQHKNYSSPYRGDGIMNTRCELMPDDITGLIVLIDKTSGKERTFRPLDNLPGMIKDGRFLLPEDASKITEQDLKKLKRELRISKNEYIRLLDKYDIKSVF